VGVGGWGFRVGVFVLGCGDEGFGCCGLSVEALVLWREELWPKASVEGLVLWREELWPKAST
jgi:hypothetical protein